MHNNKIKWGVFLLRFGEESAMKMVDWVEEHYEDVKETCSVLDLGCGNGHLLLDLAELGFEDLTGIDYSPAAIQLAQKIAQDKELDHVIHYEAVDFLAEKETLEWCTKQSSSSNDSNSSGNTDPPSPKKFMVLLDKGTYDAISLHSKNKKEAAAAAAAAAQENPEAESTSAADLTLAENDDNMEELVDRYPKRVASMMHDDGRLLITSCNWTQPELIQRFGDGKLFQSFFFVN
jgi:SAM-dependent methyltransferase